MEIGTNLSILTGMASLLGAMPGAGTPGETVSGGSDFGPAALLSLGQGASSASSGVDYTQLAGLAMQLHAQAPPTISPKQAKQEKETIKQATALRVNGRFDDARSLLEDLLKKNPRNAVAVHGLGAIEMDQGHYVKAQRYFEKAHYMAPQYGFDQDATNARLLQKDDATVLKSARRLVAQPSTRDQGIRLLVALTKKSPSNAEARVLLAEKLVESGDAANGLTQYQLAISTAAEPQLRIIEAKLSALLKQAPEAAFLNNLLGQTQLKLGKHELAARTLARASQLANQDPLYLADEALAQVALGRDAAARGDVNGAMRFFRAAEQLDPLGDEVKKGMVEGYVARAQWRMRMGDVSSAVDDFKVAATKLEAVDDDELKQSVAEGLYRAGLILERRREADGGEVGKEVVAFQAAYDLDPDNVTYASRLAATRATLGDQYLADGNYKEAAYAYKAAHELRPHDTGYRQSAIDAFLSYGDERAAIYDHTAAIDAYKEAYDLDKTNDKSKSRLAGAYNTRGVWYRSLGTDFYDEARADFLEALHLYPDNDEYQDNYDSVS